ncbi:MAG: putative CAMK family protein kinase [Streblomastix strix]|uniref:non-specific serine/threonine protein kinase n=1 Tax=Streblomastix strix TaxID=222440 RepID=A0A5J4VNB2_9EUKA|nr:MAG: putative CAMK family protein kinase [Streblomastix strix]
MLSDYRVVQKIGSGGFGTVYRAIENCSKKQVCLKIVRLAQKVDFGEVLREAQLLQQFDIPFIVKCYKCFVSEEKLIMVMDLCEFGDVQAMVDFAKSNGKNIFLTKEHSAKLGDFGVSRVLSNSNSMANTQAGTPYYYSPEICAGQSYNHKSDVWSVGIVLYELCSLKKPFQGKDDKELLDQIMNKQDIEEIPRTLEIDLMDVIKESQQTPRYK